MNQKIQKIKQLKFNQKFLWSHKMNVFYHKKFQQNSYQIHIIKKCNIIKILKLINF